MSGYNGQITPNANDVRRSLPAGFGFSENTADATTLSVQQKKPLLMLISDASEVSRQWIEARFQGNDLLRSPANVKTLQDAFVLLHIYKESTDYEFLVQLFPQFVTIQIPAVLVVSDGKIRDLLPRDLTVAQFNERLRRLAPSLSGAAPTSTPTPARQLAKPTSLKEQGDIIAAEKYRQNQLRLQQESELEHQRILRLVKMDRREIASDEREEHRTVMDGPVRENLHNRELDESLNYTIQVKLMDGHAVRHSFPSDTPLGEVRQWVLLQHPEYEDTPFYFYKSVDRVTYCEEKEQMTLRQLQLNRATLIVKPMDAFERKRENERRMSQSNDEGLAGSTFSWLRSKIGSYLWNGQQKQQQQPQQQQDITLSDSPVGASEPLKINHNSQPLYHDAVEATESAGVSAVASAGTTDDAVSRQISAASSFNIYGKPQLLDTDDKLAQPAPAPHPAESSPIPRSKSNSTEQLTRGGHGKA